MQELRPRPPYYPGMQQSGWQNQHPQAGFQTFYASPQGFPQQYALVPLNGGAGMPPVGPPPPGPGMPSPHMINGPGMNTFSGPTPMGSAFGGQSAGGRGPGPRPPPGQPSWGQGGPMGRGRGSEGRGRAQGRARGAAPSPGRGGRAFPPMAGGRGGPSSTRGPGLPPPMTPPSPGMTKDQKKNAKAMAKLDKVVQAEGPRVYKALSEEERLEAARWQAERRKHYPTAANLSQKADAAASREARGELEPEQALRRKRLQEVLMRQRELGVAQIAGTSHMLIQAHPSMSSPGFVPGGRGGRGGGRTGGRAGRSPGRGFGRGPGGGVVSNGPGRPQPGTKRGLELGEGQQADKRQKSANGETVADGQIGGLASLMQYGSDDDGDTSTRPNGIADTPHSQAGQSQPSTPQTAEEKQALYLKQRAQYERQQQQHQASMEKRQKAQEKWESKGRGRGRGRGQGSAGRATPGGRHSARGAAAQQAKRAPTLLQKLLVKDIRKDHSYLLQCFRFFVNNNFLQDVGSKPLVYPEPPPTLRDILPPIQDGGDSQDSEGEDVENSAALPPAVGGGTAKANSQQLVQVGSESDSKEEEDEDEGDGEEEGEGDAEGQLMEAESIAQP